MKAVAIDIESNNLLSEMLDFREFPYKLKDSARIWVISFCDIESGETKSLVKEEITKESIDNILKNYDFIVQHNGIKFDLKVLGLFGLIDYKVGWLEESDMLNGRKVRFIDTLILSRLLSPDKYGGHSLKAWGERLGTYKDNFRQDCIDAGIITKDSPKGSEFAVFWEGMKIYCEQDTKVTAELYKKLIEEMGGYGGWKMAFKMETKLADLAISRESLGFWFDKDLAIQCLEDLTQKMEELRNKVNPHLPPKPMNKGEMASYTAPATQISKKGTPSHYIVKFAERIGATIEHQTEEDTYYIKFEEKRYKLPHNEPLKTTVEADISNLDHVKMTLINVHGWEPSEWAERDFTKDSKKQNLSYEKRIAAVNRWLDETVNKEKYKKHRLEIAFENFKVNSLLELRDKLYEKLNEDYPVRLPTSPKVRVGVEKELCPDLLSLGEKVDFAKDFALYLTYKHRRSSIAGGEIEDMDFDSEYPNKGYLSMYREEDGRVPTPAIEIGASTNRYRHIGVANVARSSSVYGKQMRSLFGCGKGYVQLGFDYSSLEARVQGHYILPYPGGKELAESLVAEKPNDVHSVNSRKLGIDRGTVKSVAYAILYGCSPKKLEKMLGYSPQQAKKFYDDYWDAVPALRDFKQSLEQFWETTGDKEHLQAIDGRKLNTRSKHSLVNLMFQSCGVIFAKYVSVLLMHDMEKQGYCIDPFKGKPDVCSMVEYHDEEQLFCNPKLFSFKLFKTEEEAKEFEKNWDSSQGQLSSIGESEKGFYITLPNVISKSITKTILEVEKLLKINVPLGYEWITGKNWAQCH